MSAALDQAHFIDSHPAQAHLVARQISAEETDDALGAAKGIVLGLGLSMLFWVPLAYFVFR